MKIKNFFTELHILLFRGDISFIRLFRSLEKRLESFDPFDSFDFFDPKNNYAEKNWLNVGLFSLILNLCDTNLDIKFQICSSSKLILKI